MKKKTVKKRKKEKIILEAENNNISIEQAEIEDLETQRSINNGNNIIKILKKIFNQQC